MAALGLRLCARALSSRGKRGPLLIAVRGPLTTAASPAAEHRLQTRRLSSRGPRAQPLSGMWDPPRPGLEPASPAPAGRPSTTAPPGKPDALDSLVQLSGKGTVMTAPALDSFSPFPRRVVTVCLRRGGEPAISHNPPRLAFRSAD